MAIKKVALHDALTVSAPQPLHCAQLDETIFYLCLIMLLLGNDARLKKI